MTSPRRPATPPAACPLCDAALDRHQPDEGDPERLIGTCSDCGAWSLLERGTARVIAEGAHRAPRRPRLHQG